MWGDSYFFWQKEALFTFLGDFFRFFDGYNEMRWNEVKESTQCCRRHEMQKYNKLGCNHITRNEVSKIFQCIANAIPIHFQFVRFFSHCCGCCYSFHHSEFFVMVLVQPNFFFLDILNIAHLPAPKCHGVNFSLL